MRSMPSLVSEEFNPFVVLNTVCGFMLDYVGIRVHVKCEDPESTELERHIVVWMFCGDERYRFLLYNPNCGFFYDTTQMFVLFLETYLEAVSAKKPSWNKPLLTECLLSPQMKCIAEEIDRFLRGESNFSEYGLKIKLDMLGVFKLQNRYNTYSQLRTDRRSVRLPGLTPDVRTVDKPGWHLFLVLYAAFQSASKTRQSDARNLHPMRTQPCGYPSGNPSGTFPLHNVFTAFFKNTLTFMSQML